METRKYAIVIEKARNNYSAYVPDLPGCVSTGKTVEEANRNILAAIGFHLRGMAKDGDPMPEQPTSVVTTVDVPFDPSAWSKPAKRRKTSALASSSEPRVVARVSQRKGE